MALDISNIGGPIIASRSRVNDETRKYGTFLASHSQLLLKRIVDGDPESFWHDTGLGDGVPSTLQLSSQFRTALISLPVNLLALQNINWKRFKVEYSNTGGAPWTIVPGLNFTGVDNTLTDIVVAPAEFTANQYLITVTSAFGPLSPNEKKQLGGFYPCKSILQLTRGMLSNPIAPRKKVRENELANGNVHRQLRLRSALSHEHYKSNPTFDLVPDAELELMRKLGREGTTFTWFPEPGSRNRLIHTCQFKGPINSDYVSSFRGSGHRVSATVDEVGRL